MYNYNVLIHKQNDIPHIPDYINLVYCWQNNDIVIHFTTDDMRPKFEAFSKKKCMH